MKKPQTRFAKGLSWLTALTLTLSFFPGTAAYAEEIPAENGETISSDAAPSTDAPAALNFLMTGFPDYAKSEDGKFKDPQMQEKYGDFKAAVGTSLDSLNLPDSLKIEGYFEADGPEVPSGPYTLLNIEWKLKSDTNETYSEASPAGEYTFIPDFDVYMIAQNEAGGMVFDSLRLSEGTKAPQIKVSIEEPVPETIPETAPETVPAPETETVPPVETEAPATEAPITETVAPETPVSDTTVTEFSTETADTPSSMPESGSTDGTVDIIGGTDDSLIGADDSVVIDGVPQTESTEAATTETPATEAATTETVAADTTVSETTVTEFSTETTDTQPVSTESDSTDGTVDIIGGTNDSMIGADDSVMIDGVPQTESTEAATTETPATEAATTETVASETAAAKAPATETATTETATTETATTETATTETATTEASSAESDIEEPTEILMDAEVDDGNASDLLDEGDATASDTTAPEAQPVEIPDLVVTVSVTDGWDSASYTDETTNNTIAIPGYPAASGEEVDLVPVAEILLPCEPLLDLTSLAVTVMDPTASQIYNFQPGPDAFLDFTQEDGAHRFVYTTAADASGNSYTYALDVMVSTEDHVWDEGPTCTEPQYCTVCGLENPDVPATGHDFAKATCTQPKTCKNCGITEGNPLGHDWQAATCTKPETCKRESCQATRGKALGHQMGNWVNVIASTDTTHGTAERYCQRDYCDHTETTPLPIIGDPAKNGISNLAHGENYKLNTTLSFQAIGAGMQNTQPINGDVRYVPSSWKIQNTPGAFRDNYSGAFSITVAGSYTLTVTYQKQVYQDGWQVTDIADSKSITFTVGNLVQGTPITGTDNGIRINPKTGDNTPIVLLVVALIAAAAAIAGVIIYKKKRR